MTKPIDTGGLAFDKEVAGFIFPGSMTWLDFAAISLATAISKEMSECNLSYSMVADTAYELAQALLARKREIEKGEA